MAQSKRVKVTKERLGARNACEADRPKALSLSVNRMNTAAKQRSERVHKEDSAL